MNNSEDKKKNQISPDVYCKKISLKDQLVTEPAASSSLTLSVSLLSFVLFSLISSAIIMSIEAAEPTYVAVDGCVSLTSLFVCG